MTEQTLQQLGRLLADAEHIAVLTGAGMSTESGIPDFRSADGLWSRDRSLADVVSIDYFREQPEAFWQAFKDIFRIKLMRDYLPNDGHHFLAALEQAGKRVSVLTQNIDGLHHRAGSRHVLELHGTLLTASCPSCGAVHDLDYVNYHALPECTHCHDILKPDVVLYGESVPMIEQAFVHAVDADVLLVMGSSLEVSPVNLIPLEAARTGVATALVNFSTTRMDHLFDVRITGGIGETCRALQQQMALG